MKRTFCLILFFLSCSLFSVEAKDFVASADSISVQIVDNDVVTLNSDTANRSWVGSVVDWYLEHLNYYTVTLLMTIESSFVPFPSEVVVPPAAYHACDAEAAGVLYVTDSKFINVLLVVLFATLGALIGGFINYYLAFFLGRPIIYAFADSKIGHLCLLNSEKIKKAEEYFIKHGNASTFIGRLVPGIRQLISIPAGLAKMNIGSFVLYTCLGSGLWNVILAVVGYVLHGQQDMINRYISEISYGLLIVGVLFVGYLIWKKRRERRNAPVSRTIEE